MTCEDGWDGGDVRFGPKPAGQRFLVIELFRDDERDLGEVKGLLKVHTNVLPHVVADFRDYLRSDHPTIM